MIIYKVRERYRKKRQDTKERVANRRPPRPQDIITGDEVLSDSYDIKEVDGVVYEADGAMITVKKGVDVGTYTFSLALSLLTKVTR